MKLELYKPIIHKPDGRVWIVRGWKGMRIWGTCDGIAMNPKHIRHFKSAPVIPPLTAGVHPLVRSLHELYCASGKNMSEFTREVGVSHQSVNHWFSGTEPSIVKLSSAFAALGYEIKEVKI